MYVTCNVGTVMLLIHLYIVYIVYIGIVEWPARCIHRNTLFMYSYMRGVRYGWLVGWDFKRDPHNMILPC